MLVRIYDLEAAQAIGMVHMLCSLTEEGTAMNS